MSQETMIYLSGKYNRDLFRVKSSYCDYSVSVKRALDIPQNGQNSIAGQVPFSVSLSIRMSAIPEQ